MDCEGPGMFLMLPAPETAHCSLRSGATCLCLEVPLRAGSRSEESSVLAAVYPFPSSQRLRVMEGVCLSDVSALVDCAF